jgi:hypothetical protein
LSVFLHFPSIFTHVLLLNETSCGTPKALGASGLCSSLLTAMAAFGNIGLWRSTLVKIESSVENYREKSKKIDMFDLFPNNDDIESELHIVLFN